MKRAALERNIVVVLFVLVLIVFSFAERDSKKLDQLYKGAQSFEPVKQEKTIGASEPEKQLVVNRFTRN